MDAPSARLRVRVAPGARRSGVVGRHGDAWRIRVSSPPERGRANDEVLDLLATALDLRRRQVRIVSGAGSREKVVELRGLGADEAEQRLLRAGSAA